jgi:hypothetical protein
MLKKEFVPYEQALALKELGFDEPCFATYQKGLKGPIMWDYWSIELMNSTNEEDEVECTAPTFSQAFRWFRETYNIDAWVQPFVAQSKKNIPYLPDESYGYFIFKDGVFVCDKVDLLGPEEAELACLIELIKIAKENKQ